jgi:hypothetical protein
MKKLALATLALTLGACSGSVPEAPSTSRSSSTRPSREAESEAAPPIAVRPLPPSTYPAPERLVAIGDVHGDLDAFRSVLRLAGAIDAADHWAGGALFVVQTGDLLDRGDDEDEILALVLRLEAEASEAGGHFVALDGNHEIMNAQGDFRYVTPDGFADFASFAEGSHARSHDAPRAGLPREARGRSIAFAPGGRYARELAARNTVVVVGDTVLVHGGLVARQLGSGIDAINQAVRSFFLAEAPLSPMLTAEDSPVWHRGFALEADGATCAALDEALALVPARRMVVGHTVQRAGINAACDGRVWRIDVGLARLYDGPIEALEITADGARVLHGAR